MTPKALLYLELGVLPARYIIKSRRLKFLYYIINQNEQSLIKKFFNAQIGKLYENRLNILDLKNLTELEINLDIENIKLMSKNKFKIHIIRESVPEEEVSDEIALKIGKLIFLVFFEFFDKM